MELKDHCNEHAQYDYMCVGSMHARRAFRAGQPNIKKSMQSVKTADQRRNKDADNYREHRAKYPGVYQWIVTTAVVAKIDKGHDSWSVSAAIEIIRWQGLFPGSQDADGWKISDQTASHYAREIMMKVPLLYGFF